MKIAETGVKPGGVEAIQGTHLRHIKPEPQAQQMGKRDELTGNSKHSQIQEEKSRLNELSVDVRMTDKSHEAAEKLLYRLYREMQGVVKQYPPYPPGSEERVERLKGIAAIRKEIDQLTIPPVEKSWSEPTSTIDFEASSIKTTDELTGKIPELDPSATDAQIQQAMNDVRQSGDAVSRWRHELHANAGNFFRHGARKSQWEKFFEGIPGVDSALSADSASGRAKSVVDYLQTEGSVRSLTLESSLLTDFLG